MTKMTKEQAIEQLSSIKRDLDQMEKFAGQARAKTEIEKKISFLMKYKSKGGQKIKPTIKQVEKLRDECISKKGTHFSVIVSRDLFCEVCNYYIQRRAEDARKEEDRKMDELRRSVSISVY